MHAFNSRASFFSTHVCMRIVRTGTSLIVCLCLGNEGLGYNALWIGGQRIWTGRCHLLSLVSHTEEGLLHLVRERIRVTNYGANISVDRQTDRKWRKSKIEKVENRAGNEFSFAHSRDFDPTSAHRYSSRRLLKSHVCILPNLGNC